MRTQEVQMGGGGGSQAHLGEKYWLLGKDASSLFLAVVWIQAFLLTQR